MVVTLASDVGTFVFVIRLQGEGQVCAWTLVTRNGVRTVARRRAIMMNRGLCFMTSAIRSLQWSRTVFAGLRGS